MFKTRNCFWGKNNFLATFTLIFDLIHSTFFYESYCDGPENKILCYFVWEIVCAKLDGNLANKIYCGQLIRCSSSVGANYRATRRAKSRADFTNKFKIVEEELDEALYFLQLLKEFNPEERNVIEQLY